MVGFHLSYLKWNSIANPSSSFPSIIDATLAASSSSPKNLTKPSPIPSFHSNLWSFPRLSLHRTSMADPSNSHNKSHWALSLTLNPSSISLSSWLQLSLNPCSFISKTLLNELLGRPSQAHPLTSTSPPQAASLHQTLTEPTPNPSSLSSQASLGLPRSLISNHQPPPLHSGSFALCILA